jgi:hypothetical protein
MHPCNESTRTGINRRLVDQRRTQIKNFNYCQSRNLLNNMEPKLADSSIIAGFCILIILAVSIAGCTGPNAGTTTPVTTPAQSVPTSIATTSALLSQPPTQTQAAASAPTQTQTTIQATQSPDPVSLTINSANKQTKVYTMTPKPGRIFLVLDITVKNNAVEKGFDLTDASLSLSYARAGTSPEPSITSQVRGGLDNPILMPTRIEQNDKRTGQVVFGVLDVSNMYTINLIGKDGTVVSSATVTVK